MPLDYTLRALAGRMEASRLQAALSQEAKGREVGPCEGCSHADRCREGLACRSLELFVNTGRFSAVAPRQPSRALYLRLYPEAAAVSV